MNATIEQVRALVGKDVQFTKKIEDTEWYAEDGMRGTITSVIVQDDDPKDMVIKIGVSFAKFDEFNKQFETSNYFNNVGDACLTARQANMYHVEDHYYAGNDVLEHMIPLDDATATLLRFFETDKAANPDLTYVAWLEKIAASAFHFTKD